MISSCKGDPTARVKLVEYFPFTIIFDDNTNTSRHVMFEHKDIGCLELALEQNNGRLLKMTLVLCKNYSMQASKVPAPNAISSTLHFDLPRTTSCERFDLDLFDDGFKLTLESNPVANRHRAGNLLFEVDESDSIVAIYATNLSESEIEHIVREIDYDRE